MVGVVHGTGRQQGEGELVRAGFVVQAAAPVAVEEARDLLTTAVGPDKRRRVRAKVGRHHVLPEPRWRLAAVVRPVMAHAEVVSDLVRDGVREREARVLVDVAAALRLTHAGHLGQPQRRAQLQPGRAHVEPGDEDGEVVVVRVALVGRVDKALPAAEALQRPVGRLVDAQLIELLGGRQRLFLRSFGLEEDHADQNHVDGVADTRVVEQR